jgi:hypothetical protein
MIALTSRGPVLGLVAFAIAFAILLAGCASANTKPHAAPRPEAPSDCSGFLKLSPAKRAAIYAGTKKVSHFTATGFDRVTVDVIDAESCASAKGSELLGNVEVDGELAQCDLFSTLTPEVQRAWLDALPSEPYYGLTTPASAAQYSAACTAFDAGNLIAAGNYLKSFRSNDAFVSWQTESKLGYTESIALAVGSPESAEQLSADDLATISSCDFAKDTDGVVPLYLFMKDTTSDKAPQLSARFSLSTPEGATLVTTTARIAASFTSGPSCTNTAQPFAPIDFGVTSTGKATDNFGQKYTSWTSYSTYWVVLKNWVSPRNPGGANGELAGYTLSSRAQVSADDPIVSFTKASIHLDGSRG